MIIVFGYGFEQCGVDGCSFVVGWCGCWVCFIVVGGDGVFDIRLMMLFQI